MKTFFFGCLAVLLANPLASSSWTFVPGESKTILDEKVVDFPLKTPVDQSKNFYLPNFFVQRSDEYIAEFCHEQARPWTQPLHLELKPDLYQELSSAINKKISYHFQFVTNETWENAEGDGKTAKPISTSGVYNLHFNQYFRLEPDQNLRFPLPFVEQHRFLDDETPGWLLADPKLTLSHEKNKGMLNLTSRAGLDLLSGIRSYRHLNYYGVLFKSETYLQKLIIKIDTQKENLLKIPMQFHTMVDHEVDPDPKNLKEFYLDKLRREVFPQIHLSYSQTEWDFERFENECNWTTYKPKLALNTLNFTLHALDPQVLGEVKFRLFIQKQVPINLKLTNHYQLKIPATEWVELIKKEVQAQGYPVEWLTYNLTDHQLKLESANPLAFQFEPKVLTYEIYKDPGQPKKDSEGNKPKDKNKDKSKPGDKPKDNQEDKSTSEGQQPEKNTELKPSEVTQKVNSASTKKGFNPKYLYFLFIPFVILVVYLIIFFWKKHKHKKGKC